MIQLDPSITAEFSGLVRPPTHARLFHRTIRVHDPNYELPSEWFSIGGTFVQAAYLLGTLNPAGEFIPTPKQYSPPILALVDPAAAEAQTLLAADTAPTPNDPTVPMTVNKPKHDCRIVDIDAVVSALDLRLKGTVVPDPA
jgi:hypothetical protein